MTNTQYSPGAVHYGGEAHLVHTHGTTIQKSAFDYDFQNFFHPRVGEMIGTLNRGTLTDMMAPTTLAGFRQEFFDAFYKVQTSSDLTSVHSHPKEVDVDPMGPYANYNWELLFHLPVAVATQLSKNQRFADAQRWFHYVFDPTCNETSVSAPSRYWKFLRFREKSGVDHLQDLLILMSKPDSNCTPEERARKKQAIDGYHQILLHPFQPHAVARSRQGAYQYMVVMKYLDNLIAWGDSLFAQDTVESINEATQLYVLAANLLGPRPQRVPPVGTTRPKTFADLKAAGLDAMSNALVELEAQFPFNMQGTSTGSGSTGAAGSALFGIGRTLYFSVPRNNKLLGYWDTVADRLYKIRHSLNLQGVFRQLALFDPPIDPGMLVKAAAAGFDVGSIVGGMNQPLGPVRAPLLIQKALEIAGEVRALGSALLGAIEKGDAEQLARLRQRHEIALQQLTQDVRFLQWKQAQSATEALLRTRASTLERFNYYQRVLGIPAASVPEVLPLDRRSLTAEGFEEAYSALVAAYDTAAVTRPYPRLALAGDVLPPAVADAGKLALTMPEATELNVLMPAVTVAHAAASVAQTIAGVLAFIPDISVNLEYWGLGASTMVFGGTKLSQAGNLVAEVIRMVGTMAQDSASMAARLAGYERRVDEWFLQYNLAARELALVGRQVIGSLIAEQVAKHEHEVVVRQTEQSQEVAQFLDDKFSSVELYGWMQGEISRLYYEYYRFAVDTARRAENTMKRELRRAELDATDFVQFNYWDGGRKGLLSGEALFLDLKRMELAYHDNNRRELEMTRHVSIRQLDPIALLALRTTGRCEVTLPETFFDRDCPGHYMRRIKSVGLSIPSVVGPYTSVNCTLTLLASSLRTSAVVPQDPGYGRRIDGEDERFEDQFGSVESVVTSSAVNDSGMFDTNLKDDRFLPFEGKGAVSRWRLELPAQLRGFDYQTISDVVLHLRYTARDGGSVLAAAAASNVTSQLQDAAAGNQAMLLSLPHDYPGEWSSFTTGTTDLVLSLTKEMFPYLVQDYLAQGSPRTLVIDAITLHVPNGRALATRTVKSTERSGDVSTSALTLTLPPDNQVLARTQAGQVYLVVRYHLG